MEETPCTTAKKGAAWFPYDDSDRQNRSRANRLKAAKAAELCRTQCPLATQRRCARKALETPIAAYGIWAGVELPGISHRFKDELAAGKALLRRIADGELDPRELTAS